MHSITPVVVDRERAPVDAVSASRSFHTLLSSTETTPPIGTICNAIVAYISSFLSQILLDPYSSCAHLELTHSHNSLLKYTRRPRGCLYTHCASNVRPAVHALHFKRSHHRSPCRVRMDVRYQSVASLCVTPALFVLLCWFWFAFCCYHFPCRFCFYRS